MKDHMSRIVAAGGAVFPVNMPLANGGVYTDSGMMLRDLFAIEALKRLPYNPETSYEATAAEAYKMADALIAERAK